MNEDVAALLMIAFGVIVGSQSVVVLGHEVVHVLALAIMLHLRKVDNLIVPFAVIITGIDGGGYVDIIELATFGFGFHAEGLYHMEYSRGRLTVALASLANAVFAHIYGRGKQHFAIDSESSRGLTALDVINFQQLSFLVSWIVFVAT